MHKSYIIILFLALTTSCKNEKSQAELVHEQLIAKENELLEKKLTLEQEKIEEEIIKEQEKRSEAIEKDRLASFITAECTPFVNKIFLKWASNWAIDNYLDESAIIEDFEKKGNIVKFEGRFKFKRLSTVKIGKFEGSIDVKEDEMKIKELCYTFESESSCI